MITITEDQAYTIIDKLIDSMDEHYYSLENVHTDEERESLQESINAAQDEVARLEAQIKRAPLNTPERPDQPVYEARISAQGEVHATVLVHADSAEAAREQALCPEVLNKVAFDLDHESLSGHRVGQAPAPTQAQEEGRSNSSCSTLWDTIERMAVASTSHLEEAEADALAALMSDPSQPAPFAGMMRPEGFLFSTSFDFDERFPTASEVLASAKEAGLHWVLFDRDGDEIDGMAVYAWGEQRAIA